MNAIVLRSAEVAPLKTKGDLAELKVAADLAGRGYRLLWPHGEDHDYDLIGDKGSELLRVQVKYTESDGRAIDVRCYSKSLTNGKVMQTKCYTAETVDCIAVFDRTTDRCYYVSASVLGSGRFVLRLRLQPAANNQQLKIRRAEEYLDPPVKRVVRLPLMRVEQPSTLFEDRGVVEPAGIEPATSDLQNPRSAN